MRSLKSLAGVARSFVVYYGQVWRNAGRRRFYAQFLNPGDLAFDVGAHVGDRVRTWRQLGARVVAVEPQPVMADVLQRLYGRDASVRLERVALGAKPGRATLHVSSANPTLTTLSREWIDEVQADARFRPTRWDQQVEVEVTTLDALIARHGVPRFCKIDVEGFELSVLEGLSQPIAALSFEYIPVSKTIAQACVRKLAALGPYRFRSSRVETMRFTEPDWVSADALIAFLDALPIDERSGDVYARL
ncbi:MAG TPA: FkbM family methyltransferase [Archangium sp.]